MNSLGRPKDVRKPLKNRGAQAWEVVSGLDTASVWMHHQHPELSNVVTRAEVHAVTDDTNKAYLKAVFRVMEIIERGVRTRRWPPPRNTRELDAVLAAIVDHLIFIDNENQGLGRNLHAAWLHVFPESQESLPSFSRSVLGWSRLQPPGEQQGLCIERWGAISRSMWENVHTRRDEESAVWYDLQKDTYCREQDMEGLRNTPQDIAVRHLPKGQVQVALFFGLSSRGESVKTSQQMPNQGVVVDEPWIASLLVQHLARVREGDKIFRVSREEVMERVAAAVARLNLDPLNKRLHVLRHTGPANDIATEKRTLEQARRRGRWLSLRSLERYTKVAHLVADLSRMPPRVVDYGREFLADPPYFAKLRPAEQISVYFEGN